MEIPKEIKNHFGGNPFINIGDENCCMFCPPSIHLIELLKKYPLLYFAIIEGVKCAEQGYYAAGIIAFSQLLKNYSVDEPKERHMAAHEFLKKQPSKKDYQSVRELFFETATKKMIGEFYRHKSKGNNYKNEFDKAWGTLMNAVHISN